MSWVFCRLWICKIASLRDIPKTAGSLNNSSSNNKASSLRLSTSKQSLKRVGLCSQIATDEYSSRIVFPEKCGKVKASKRSTDAIGADAQDPAKVLEHRNDIEGKGGGGGDGKSDLLGYVVFSGKLVLDERKTTTLNNTRNSEQICDITNQEAVDAKLTSKALVWGSNVLPLDDLISVSYNIGLRHFTVHSYPLRKASCGLSCFIKSPRTRKDFCFVASSTEEAVQWVGGFVDQQCYVNWLPHPLTHSKEQASSELLPTDTPPELLFRCKTPPKMLVILNPRSGRGRSNKVFYGIVEPIFKLAGFRLEVVETTFAGHAKKIASSVDFSTCPDGIICVGGDGIINEVLNGLLSRDNQKEGISIPIGIIPAGSDNSLVWTVLGVRDPVSAAMAIVKGGLTATDIFAVEWTEIGKIHFGLTVSYYGFVSDVLEISENYRKCFGPMRYFVAGLLKFLCLPKYSYEVEYLPALKDESEVADMSELYTDIMRRSNTDGIPRASSLSSIDSIMTLSHMSGGDLDTCSSIHASTEASELAHGLDPKSKRLSSGRNNFTAEPEVMHAQLPLPIASNWPGTRSKSRTDKGWTGLSITHDTSRFSRENTTTNDREDTASMLSDPGPVWDAEPNRDVENFTELPGSSDETETGAKNLEPAYEEKWIVSKGQLLGILVCSHACRTIQSSQVVAPKAQPDDNTLDLILVQGSGRLRLLIFFLLLQLGWHLSLPYVEYVKVTSVRIKPRKHTHSGCGIDGEFFPHNGQVISSLFPAQCKLIGHFNGSHHR